MNKLKNIKAEGKEVSEERIRHFESEKFKEIYNNAGPGRQKLLRQILELEPKIRKKAIQRKKDTDDEVEVEVEVEDHEKAPFFMNKIKLSASYQNLLTITHTKSGLNSNNEKKKKTLTDIKDKLQALNNEAYPINLQPLNNKVDPIKLQALNNEADPIKLQALNNKVGPIKTDSSSDSYLENFKKQALIVRDFLNNTEVKDSVKRFGFGQTKTEKMLNGLRADYENALKEFFPETLEKQQNNDDFSFFSFFKGKKVNPTESHNNLAEEEGIFTLDKIEQYTDEVVGTITVKTSSRK